MVTLDGCLAQAGAVGAPRLGHPAPRGLTNRVPCGVDEQQRRRCRIGLGVVRWHGSAKRGRSGTLAHSEVIVDVAAGVLPDTREVFSGERKYLLTLPVGPGAGAIGRVRANGPGATRLAAGDRVSCDPTVRSRDDVIFPQKSRIGLS